MPIRNSVNLQKVVVGSSAGGLGRTFVFDIFAIIAYGGHIVRRIFRQDYLFKLDRTLLTYLISNLPNDFRSIAESQVEEANYSDTVHYKSKSETIIRKVSPLGFSLSRKRKFNFKNIEMILATATFKCKGRKYKVDYIVVENSLSFIVFDRSTKSIVNESDIELINFDLDPVAVDQFGYALEKQGDSL